MIQNKLQLPDKLARIRLWEQARTYAQKMKTQLFIVLNELKYQSPAREVFESSPEFSWLSKSKEFQKVMEGFPSAEREMDQLLLSGQLANPLIAALDIRTRANYMTKTRIRNAYYIGGFWQRIRFGEGS